MGRQSSSPDSLTFENIYQLPFFMSGVSPEYDVCQTQRGQESVGTPKNPLKSPLSKRGREFRRLVPHRHLRRPLLVLFDRLILAREPKGE